MSVGSLVDLLVQIFTIILMIRFFISRSLANVVAPIYVLRIYDSLLFFISISLSIVILTSICLSTVQQHRFAHCALAVSEIAVSSYGTLTEESKATSYEPCDLRKKKAVRSYLPNYHATDASDATVALPPAILINLCLNYWMITLLFS